MNDLNDRIIQIKTTLMASLGENANQYLSNMKMWFRNKWSKEEFDGECRKFLTADILHLHNQFFIAILNKIDAFQIPQPTTPVHIPTSSTGTGSSSRSSRKRKRSSRTSERITFEPVDLLEFIATDNVECIRPIAGIDGENGQTLPKERYCVNELYLPDSGFMLGRFLIGAWESGLVSVEDKVAEYMAMAVQVLLKNLISAIILTRKHYKVTGEGTFYYDVGTQLKDPFVRNTVTRQKVDDLPLELDKEITSPNFMRNRSYEEVTFLAACEEVYPQENDFITLKDAHNALSDRNLIASHSIYAINMERMVQMMNQCNS